MTLSPIEYPRLSQFFDNSIGIYFVGIAVKISDGEFTWDDKSVLKK